MSALYGPRVDLACSHGAPYTAQPLPFDLACVVYPSFSTVVPTDATWTFGDGGAADGLTVVHTYTEPGTYTVRVEARGTDPSCVTEDDPDGAWTSAASLPHWVHACGPPRPEFTIEHVDGLTWQVRNETDVSVYGCHQDIVWTVHRGDDITGEAAITRKGWEPVLTMPEEGTFTVLVHLASVSGTGAARLTIEAVDEPGDKRACDGSRTAALVPLLGLLRRRRTPITTDRAPSAR